MQTILIAGMALSIVASSAQASNPDISGVYRCALETDDSNERKIKPGSEFIVATWLASMSIVWPFGATDRANDCEDVGTQRTCKNDEEHLILAYDSGSKKFYSIRKMMDIRGVEVERRTISGTCQPMDLRYSTEQ
ncbi:hypothetical protein [Brucella intermedia]|uniref:hypothetical protein n=1 Tax=Brucella intermedia TaxID=94625 RepID=UPI0007C6B4EB|nr:hypothetical protein [Brucella intermedia]OAE43941.1 hypothetical protein A7J42_00700 [Brucella intermedia]